MFEEGELTQRKSIALYLSWLFLLPANVKNGGRDRLENIMKEGHGKWDTRRRLGSKIGHPEREP
jgi:hypothetical protein